MRVLLVLVCLFAVGYGFSGKKLLLELGRLHARQAKVDLGKSLGLASRGLLNRANDLKKKENHEVDRSFLNYVIRTAKTLSVNQFHDTMEKECGSDDSNNYINAQAITSDIVFEYATALPEELDKEDVNDVEDKCMLAGLYYNMRFRADLFNSEDDVPDICRKDYEGDEWIGSRFCTGYKEKLNG